MTAMIGNRKHDAEGRSTSKLRGKRLNKRLEVETPFVTSPMALLDAEVFHALSPYALKAFMRILTEHGRHAGKENGRLIVTYQNFVDYGIPRSRVRPALNELHHAGIIRFCDPEDRYKNTVGRPPNVFRLTFLAVIDPSGTDVTAATNDFKKATADSVRANQAIAKQTRARQRNFGPRREYIDSSADVRTKLNGPNPPSRCGAEVIKFTRPNSFSSPIHTKFIDDDIKDTS